MLTKRWSNFEISNFEYLMQLNSLAGRSFRDISQYPVFPWLITSFAERLDIAKILARSSKNLDGGYAMAGLLGHGDAFVFRDPAGIRPAYYYQDDEIKTEQKWALYSSYIIRKNLIILIQQRPFVGDFAIDMSEISKDEVEALLSFLQPMRQYNTGLFSE